MVTVKCHEVSLPGRRNRLKFEKCPTQAKVRVQSHEILYEMSPDILYTPARAQRAPEHTDRCHGRRWMSENNE